MFETTINELIKRFKWDAVERILWTGLELGASLGITEITPLGAWWALPIGLGLAALKALAAKHLGQRGTASTLPASADPAGAVRIPPLLS